MWAIAFGPSGADSIKPVMSSTDPGLCPGEYNPLPHQGFRGPTLYHAPVTITREMIILPLLDNSSVDPGRTRRPAPKLRVEDNPKPT
jgi:hypothetical protein